MIYCQTWIFLRVKGGFMTNLYKLVLSQQTEAVQSSSVQFSRSVVSDSLRPHESQNARPPCPSPTPRVHSDSRPSRPWCHPAISSYVVPFSSCPQSLPASKSFPMSQLFAWGSQSTGASALASVRTWEIRFWLLHSLHWRTPSPDVSFCIVFPQLKQLLTLNPVVTQAVTLYCF